MNKPTDLAIVRAIIGVARELVDYAETGGLEEHAFNLHVDRSKLDAMLADLEAMNNSMYDEVFNRRHPE